MLMYNIFCHRATGTASAATAARAHNKDDETTNSKNNE